MNLQKRISILGTALILQLAAASAPASAQPNEDVGRFLGGLLNEAFREDNRPNSSPRFSPGNRPGNNNRWYDDDYDDDRYPQNRVYYPQNQIIYTPAPVQPPAPAPVKPADNPLPVVQIKPEPNAIQLFKGRPITSAEIKAAESQFNEQITDCIQEVREGLVDQMIDPSQLISSLTTKNVDQTTQSQILQAIESNNAAQVQILWATAVKDQAEAQRLYQQVRVKQLLDEMQADGEAGALKASDIRSIRNALTKAGVPATAVKALSKPLARIEEIVKTRDVIINAVPGSPNAKVALPAFTCTIVWHPDLPEGEAISLGGDRVMIGTGGGGALEVSQATVAEAMGVPVRYDEPIRQEDYEAISSGIYLLNPATSGVAVHFAIGGEKYQIEPGQTKLIAGTENRLIKFHRGGSFGEQEYTLQPRTYKFTPTAKGWELFPYDYQVTIDNSDGTSTFCYVVDNKSASIAPKEKPRVHTSKYPIVVCYDRADTGAAYRCYFSTAKSDVKVAINAADNLWNLFPAKEGTSAVGSFTPAFGGGK